MPKIRLHQNPERTIAGVLCDTGADIATLDELAKVVQLTNEVLSDYLQVRTESIAKTVTLGGRVLSEWVAVKKQIQQTNRAHGGLFNPIRSIPIGETTHSILLGDLLNPRGSHGHGGLFLESFLTLLGIPQPDEGKWVVTVEKGHIDILLRRLKPRSIVIIENKSNDAIYQPNQLYRYWYQKMRRPYPDLDYKSNLELRSFKIVYLPSDSFKHPPENSLMRPAEWATETELPERIPIEPQPITFQDLMEHWLHHTAGKVAVTNARLTTFLHFYSELWQNP